MTIVMTMVTEKALIDNRAVPRDQLRDRIQAAAMFLFREKGFDATTVEEIARVARVAKGTVFNFFPTKGAILLRHYEAIDARFGAAMAAMLPADPKAALGRFYGEAEALLRREGPIADAIFRQIALDPDIANADIDSGDADRDAMTAYFRACKAQGTIAAGIEPVVAAHVVSDLWSSTVMDWLRLGKRYSLKLRLVTKLDAVFKGLAPLALLAFLFGAMPQARAEVASMQGLYEDDKGAVAITPFGEFGDGEFFIDFASGRAGVLIEAKDRIAIGAGMKDPKGEIGTLTRGGTVLTATYDAASRALHAVPLAREPFAVANGAVTLAGELVRRTDKEAKGTIVIVQGSNDSPRTSYGPWVMYLASRGWTVAVFDKRGSGASTGDWTKGGFSELASDVRAVAVFARTKLPKKPVGLLGISQAGWVMPLAASEGGFDFVVSLMGAGVTPGEQTMELVKGQLEGYGFGPADIEKALAYYRLDLDVTEGKRPWADVDAAYRKAAAAGAEWLLAPPEAADAPARAFLGRIADFDPMPYWAKAHAPVLAVLGAEDSLVPVEPNARLLKSVLGADHVIVVAGVNHVGMIAKTGTFAEYPTLDRFDPAYFRAFGDWLDALPPKAVRP